MDFDLQKFCEEFGFETRSYSGRGMYGRSCLGIEADGSSLLLMADMIGCANSLEEAHAIAECFYDSREDSMGLGTVVYFPRVKMEQEP